MSYGIMAYRINLGRLATRFGNPKSNKRSKARRACARIAHNMEGLYGDTDVTYMDCVEELLDAKATHQNLGAWYWYAIERIIDDLGSYLPNDQWYPSPVDCFWGHESIRLYDIDSPMKIPTPDDFPTVFVVRKDNVNDDFVESLSGEIDDAQLDQVRHWVKEASRYKQDLVMYYY